MGGIVTAMPFGRHRGQPLDELPGDYLAWLLDLDDLREPLRSRIEDEADRRHGTREPQPERPITGPIDGDCAAAIVEAGRRALAVKHHPDRGGDLRTMQAVNATADRLLGQFPRRRYAA
jgi:Putative quorum-sensing-regulated virulence factor